MQKRSRRPHGSLTKKISVSVTAEDLLLLSTRARRDHRGNVSAVLHDLVETLRREQALDVLLAERGGHRVTDDDVRRLRDEILAAPLPTSRRRPRAA